MHNATDCFAPATPQVNCPDGCKLIALPKGRFTIVDAQDYEVYSKFRWKTKRGYVTRIVKIDGTIRQLSLHRSINQTPSGLMTDHIDGDPLNNRRSNLRTVTRSQNSINARISSDNKSGFKGVSLIKRTGRFRAAICLNRQVINLGENFETPQEASEAYKIASAKYHGEYARKDGFQKVT